MHSDNEQGGGNAIQLFSCLCCLFNSYKESMTVADFVTMHERYKVVKVQT